jgi:hypothetical protein
MIHVMSSKDEGGKAVPLDTEHGFQVPTEQRRPRGLRWAVRGMCGIWCLSALGFRFMHTREGAPDVGCGGLWSATPTGCSVSTDL